MRIYTTFFILLFLLAKTQNVYSQSEFAPVGAEWYHNGYDGTLLYKSYAANDTIIMGKNCRRILQQTFIAPKDIYYAPKYKLSRPLFIYGNEDSVFIYNENFSEFTLLYVFNVFKGDTVRLKPILSVSCTKHGSEIEDVSFSFIIDSVKDIDYGGTILKTVYSTPLIEKSSSLSWDANSWSSTKPIQNIYAQKIGSLYSGFLPYCINKCVSLTVEGCSNPDTILCYNDATSDIHLIAGECGKGYINTSIDEFQSFENKIQFYPNPATDMVSIVNASLQSASSLVVLNALGQIVLQQEYKTGNKITFDAGPFARGVYLVRLENKTKGSIATGKLIKE